MFGGVKEYSKFKTNSEREIAKRKNYIYEQTKL